MVPSALMAQGTTLTAPVEMTEQATAPYSEEEILKAEEKYRNIYRETITILRSITDRQTADAASELIYSLQEQIVQLGDIDEYFSDERVFDVLDAEGNGEQALIDLLNELDEKNFYGSIYLASSFGMELRTIPYSAEEIRNTEQLIVSCLLEMLQSLQNVHDLATADAAAASIEAIQQKMNAAHEIFPFVDIQSLFLEMDKLGYSEETLRQLHSHLQEKQFYGSEALKKLLNNEALSL